jgi:olfactory receptor
MCHVLSSLPTLNYSGWCASTSVGAAALLLHTPEIHNFCELAQVTKVTCSNTLINNLLIFLAMIGGGAFPGTIFSYVQIVSSVLKMTSSKQGIKPFPPVGVTCLLLPCFMGKVLGCTSALQKLQWLSVMYSVLPQMLNPFIYSLRNRDMKEALRKLIIPV